ncbi:DUF998 domain-containing protein [Actinoplanes sp. HUAS TT8]|uniref:DUF998 domain-containing protein n=1 Tax=Actinoplanes sp. HUAS TT8 TaxID=3447453 RepID=UPI003F51DAE0
MTRKAVSVLSGAAALAIILADLLTPEYDPIGEPVSRYVNGDAGLLITFAILAMGLASAILLWRLRAAPSRTGRAALAVWTAGLLVAAVFPADPPGQWAHPSTSETVHGVAAWFAVLAFPAAAVLLSRARPIAWISVVTTVVFAVYTVDVMDGPSIPVGGLGLAERLMIATNLLWICLAVRDWTPRARGTVSVTKPPGFER